MVSSANRGGREAKKQIPNDKFQWVIVPHRPAIPPATSCEPYGLAADTAWKAVRRWVTNRTCTMDVTRYLWMPWPAWMFFSAEKPGDVMGV